MTLLPMSMLGKEDIFRSTRLIGNLYYELDKDNLTACVYDYFDKNFTELVIANTIDVTDGDVGAGDDPGEERTYKVTKIDNWTFSNISSLTSVTIGKHVESIGERAFAYCRNLATVTFTEPPPAAKHWKPVLRGVHKPHGLQFPIYRDQHRKQCLHRVYKHHSHHHSKQCEDPLSRRFLWLHETFFGHLPRQLDNHRHPGFRSL